MSILRSLLLTAALAPAGVAAQVVPGVDPVPEAPSAGAADTEAVLLLLSGYHGIPGPDAFERATPRAREILFAIATDPGASPIHRDRALASLAYWPTPELKAHYEALLESPETPVMVRHRVIGHLADAFGDTAIAAVAPFLGDDDVQLRLTAVHALQSMGSEAALAVLRVAALQEQSPVVLEQLRVSP